MVPNQNLFFPIPNFSLLTDIWVLVGVGGLVGQSSQYTGTGCITGWGVPCACTVGFHISSSVFVLSWVPQIKTVRQKFKYSEFVWKVISGNTNKGVKGRDRKGKEGS